MITFHLRDHRPFSPEEKEKVFSTCQHIANIAITPKLSFNLTSTKTKEAFK